MESLDGGGHFSAAATEISYITVEEYKELEKYCNDHYIDLVPNQNGLGHMEQWLSKDEFKELAENTDNNDDATKKYINTLDKLGVSYEELQGILNEDDLKVFETEEFRQYYRIARNHGTRSLNIDSNSIFYFGIRRK